jgi:hypothetical protein
MHRTDLIVIEDPVLNTLRMLADEAERARLTGEALQLSLQIHIRITYGIDLTNENWTLDLQRGTIVRGDSPKTTLAGPVEETLHHNGTQNDTPGS